MAGTITGTVNDANSIVALGGAEVVLVELERTERTDANGSFRFANIPAGTYTLRVTYAGSVPQQSKVTVTDDGIVSANLAVGTDIEEILVVGQQAMLASSLARQRASKVVESVLTRDAIGQFPDQNVAESARRLAGINVLNDQGEGRFIAVRGLDPTLNAASVNGTRLPSPEADTRSVALDVIPSELIESIEVKKTLTPDVDADTIGASIQINTTSAFDRKEPLLTALAETSYNNLNEQVSPKIGVDFAYPVSDKFGFSGGLSYNLRKTSTDNSEMDGWSQTDSGIVYAEDLEYRDYDVVRKRVGGSLTFDFRPDDNTTLHARGLYSQFDDTETRRRLIFAMSEEPFDGSATTASFRSDDGRIRVRRDLKDRFEGQTIQSYELAGETFSGPWTFEYSGAYSKADEHEFRTQDPTRFQRDFRTAGQLAVTFDYSDLKTTKYAITTGQAAFDDPTGYGFTALENVDGLSTDEEWAFRADIAHDFSTDMGELQVKVGA
ncbi:MAG: carboxypeptidase-like regulatory domain-containing protein, partial [Planctomycetales bacterium]|nr:carboxypeptidase-like regulatory domain-containing protein [Planctomycetales bacterium]